MVLITGADLELPERGANHCSKSLQQAGGLGAQPPEAIGYSVHFVKCQNATYVTQDLECI